LEVLAPAMLQCYLSVVGARNAGAAAAAEPVMNAGDDGLSRLDGASAYCSLLLPRCLSVCVTGYLPPFEHLPPKTTVVDICP